MSTSGWPVFPRSPIVEMLKPDWEVIGNYSDATSIEFRNLKPEHAKRLAQIGFANLRALSLRHLRAQDLHVLRLFPQIENVRIWQSNPVTSLEGLQSLPNLRICELTELGTLPSLEPVASHTGLTSLCLSSGIWKSQQVIGDLSPIGILSELRQLILVVRGPADFTPLHRLAKLEWLHFSPALAPVSEVAKLAARFPFWATNKPWLHHFNGDAEGCARCGSKRTFLYLQRKKRVWCSQCDAQRLNKILDEFESLIVHFRAAG